MEARRAIANVSGFLCLFFNCPPQFQCGFNFTNVFFPASNHLLYLCGVPPLRIFQILMDLLSYSQSTVFCLLLFKITAELSIVIIAFCLLARAVICQGFSLVETTALLLSVSYMLWLYSYSFKPIWMAGAWKLRKISFLYAFLIDVSLLDIIHQQIKIFWMGSMAAQNGMLFCWMKRSLWVPGISPNAYKNVASSVIAIHVLRRWGRGEEKI